nr:MAG TPA: Rifin [Caudoviricetes sp.]
MKGLRYRRYITRKKKIKKGDNYNKILFAIACINLITAIIGLMKIIFF